MTDEKRALLEQVKDYIDEELQGEEEVCAGFVSALVNTIDTAREGLPELVNGLQANREVAILNFLLAHRP